MGGAILVVEDELVTQRMIAASLERAGHQVTRAVSVPEAEVSIRGVLPDLVLLDWVLPDTTGVTFVRQLRTDRRTREIPIIMLTGRSEESDKVTGLEAGADDYITKPFSPRELMARIRAMLRRHAPQMPEEKVAVGGLELSPAAHRVTANGSGVELGPTEFRLLHFFMTHAERVYSRTQLLDQVWGTQVFVEERTVDVHIRRLRAALESTGMDNLIQTVRGSGYRFSIN